MADHNSSSGLPLLFTIPVSSSAIYFRAPACAVFPAPGSSDAEHFPVTARASCRFPRVCSLRKNEVSAFHAALQSNPPSLSSVLLFRTALQLRNRSSESPPRQHPEHSSLVLNSYSGTSQIDTSGEKWPFGRSSERSRTARNSLNCRTPWL